MKYTDQLYFPHDMNVAHLFADVMSIVKLPGIEYLSEMHVFVFILLVPRYFIEFIRIQTAVLHTFQYQRSRQYDHHSGRC